MKLTSPWSGLLGFCTVLFMMPLAHAVMILMEKTIGSAHLYTAALWVGIAGVALLVAGIFSSKELKATLAGLFGGLLVWTGWVEFAYVYYAHRYQVPPLIENGEVVTKPEYLIMPSSIGLWAIVMLFYIFGTRSGCNMFNWIRRKLRYGQTAAAELRPVTGNPAMTSFMEINLLLWTCYMVLLIAYDPNFLGDTHPVTVALALACLAWSGYLFVRLLKIKKAAYAVRYAMPTVIIFWTFVEIAGRWNLLHEFWIYPLLYWKEVTAIGILLAAVVVFLLWKGKHK